MTENDFILEDRITKIKSVIEKYGEDNFYISFSGGKDSTVLSFLIDMALPDNKIPRVYVDTGIELNIIRDFVKRKSETDKRIVTIKPKVPIKETLEKCGYPFKSKYHSRIVDIYQRKGFTESSLIYTRKKDASSGIARFSEHLCPKILLYQFDENFKLRISNKCCDKLKKEPISIWENENNKHIAIIGIMREEGGQRESANCISLKNGKIKAFQPLALITKNWENWLVKQYNIDICEVYKPPYNFYRTGCKGCPFAKNLQIELDILEKFFPSERKQCEIIWKPVYDEYRRINYRLKSEAEIFNDFLF